MIVKIIGYVVTVICTLYLFLIFDESVVSGILLFELIYPVISAVYLIILSRSVRYNLNRVQEMGEEGKKIRAGITVSNINKIGSLNLKMCVTFCNKWDKKHKAKQTVYCSISAGQDKTVWCSFVSEYCGPIELRLKYIRVYDFFGIFGRKIKCDKKAEINIMPLFELMPLEITKRTRDFQTDSEIYSGERRGDDPSELYQVRPYRAMDSVRDIHWKLTAKENQLMVKEHGFPLGCVILIWIDFGKCSNLTQSFSNIVKKTASLSITLSAEHCIHMAAWYEEKNSCIVKWPVYNVEDTYALIWRMMEMEPFTKEEDKEICRKESFRGQEFACEISVDKDGNILKDGEIQELLCL